MCAFLGYYRIRPLLKFFLNCCLRNHAGLRTGFLIPVEGVTVGSGLFSAAGFGFIFGCSVGRSTIGSTDNCFDRSIISRITRCNSAWLIRMGCFGLDAGVLDCFRRGGGIHITRYVFFCEATHMTIITRPTTIQTAQSRGNVMFSAEGAPRVNIGKNPTAPKLGTVRSIVNTNNTTPLVTKICSSGK